MWTVVRNRAVMPVYFFKDYVLNYGQGMTGGNVLSPE